MKHQNNITTLYNEYGLELEEIKFNLAKFIKDDKIILRKIYYRKGCNYIKYKGRNFFFD